VAALILLIPIGMAICLAGWLIGSPIMALFNLTQGKFIRAGLWLCFGLFTLNIIGVLFLDEPWADYMPIYYLIAVLVGVGEITKIGLRFRRKGPEPATGEPTQAELEVTLVPNARGVYTPNGR
jgi:hypothetical protein